MRNLFDEKYEKSILIIVNNYKILTYFPILKNFERKQSFNHLEYNL